MFICKNCLKKYKNFAILTSLGKCELCDTVELCADIPSKYLIKKEEKESNIND